MVSWCGNEKQVVAQSGRSGVAEPPSARFHKASFARNKKPQVAGDSRLAVFKIRPEGFEPPTLGSEDRCAIQLRHGRFLCCRHTAQPHFQPKNEANTGIHADTAAPEPELVTPCSFFPESLKQTGIVWRTRTKGKPPETITATRRFPLCCFASGLPACRCHSRAAWPHEHWYEFFPASTKAI